MRVRQARLEAGLSLAELARTDVSRTFIHFVETGASRPSRAVLTLIARRTRKPLSYFLRSPQPNDQWPVEDLGADLRRIAAQLRRLAANSFLTRTESQELKHVALAAKHGAVLTKVIQKRVKRFSPDVGQRRRDS